MATYAEMLAQIQAWVEDDSAEFVASIPDILQLGEDRIQRDLDLGIFAQWFSNAMTPASATQQFTKIAGELVHGSFYIDTGGVRRFVEPRSVEFVLDYNNGNPSGVPKYWATFSAHPYSTTLSPFWIFAPIPASNYTLNGRALVRATRLSGSTANSWIGDNMEDLLLKACLAETEAFLKDDGRVDMWKKDYVEALATAKRDTYPLLLERYQLTPLHLPAQPTTQR